MHITYLKIRQILTGEDGPLRLNLLIKQQIINISDKNLPVYSQMYGRQTRGSKTANITLVGLNLDR